MEVNVRLLFETLLNAYNNHPIRQCGEKLQDRPKVEGTEYYDNSYYHYIPTSGLMIEFVINHMKRNKIPFKGSSFMDIGCGIPMIPQIMSILGCRVVKGLEYNPIYCNFFKNDLIRGDLLIYNFQEYDILYAYNPLRNPLMMARGLKNIMATMSVGSHFYFNDAGGLPSQMMKDFEIVVPGQSLFYYKKQ